MAEEGGFMEFLRGISRPGGPTSSDPKKYDRYYKIEGEKGQELILKHASILHLEQEISRVQEELELLNNRYSVARGEFFIDLKKTYPDLSGKRSGGGVGYREYDGSLWAVAWDAKEQHKTQHNEETSA